jgi:hypothetical protein
MSKILDNTISEEYSLDEDFEDEYDYDDASVGYEIEGTYDP